MEGWFQHYQALFTPQECADLVAYAPVYAEEAATVGHGGAARKGVVATNIRRSAVRWLPRTDPSLRLYWDRLALAVNAANHYCFHLELDAFPNLNWGHAQFTTYHGGRGTKAGGYKWHTDNKWVPAAWTPKDRKLSCVVLLSDPKDFRGGALELEEAKSPALRQGDAMVFPSHARHQVTPVTRGLRHSLVIWAMGPRLR
jgi:PKHD-type hydroxylase